MTPLTQDPYVKVLTDDKGQVVGIATNIAPLAELAVSVTTSQAIFDKDAKGAPFVCGAS
jgi:hypothetical protein